MVMDQKLKKKTSIGYRVLSSRILSSVISVGKCLPYFGNGCQNKNRAGDLQRLFFKFSVYNWEAYFMQWIFHSFVL